jgi:hypothetical protein
MICDALRARLQRGENKKDLVPQLKRPIAEVKETSYRIKRDLVKTYLKQKRPSAEKKET